MKLDLIDYIEIIESMRLDSYYNTFSDEELIEIIDDTDFLWEGDDLNPLDI